MSIQLSRPATAEQVRPRIAEANSGSDERWRRLSQMATVGLFVIALLWSAYVAEQVLVPVLLAWAIATIVLPIVTFVQARGVPHVAASILITLLLLTFILGLLIALSAPLAYWVGRASYVGALLHEKLQSFTQPVALLSELHKGLNAIGSGGSPVLQVEQQPTSIVTGILSVLRPAIAQFVLFLGALVFYLVYRQNLRNTLVYFLRDRDARLATLRTLNDIDEHMAKYFGIFTVVNFALGLVTIAMTWLVGLPNPLLWGVLAGVLNYVPYIGPAVVIGTLSVVGLIVFPTVGQSVEAPLLYLAIVTLEGQFITPTIMSHSLQLNPFAVFLAIMFCAWLWGPVGAFLAVPLLMTLSVALGHTLAAETPKLPG